MAIVYCVPPRELVFELETVIEEEEEEDCVLEDKERSYGGRRRYSSSFRVKHADLIISDDCSLRDDKGGHSKATPVGAPKCVIVVKENAINADVPCCLRRTAAKCNDISDVDSKRVVCSGRTVTGAKVGNGLCVRCGGTNGAFNCSVDIATSGSVDRQDTDIICTAPIVQDQNVCEEKQASVCSRLKSRLKRCKLNEWLLVSALVLILITVSLLTTLLGDKDGDSNPMEVPRSTDLEEHWYVSREKWQANQPSSQWITFNATQTCVIISDTATRPCTDLSDCTALVKEIQESHMKDYNYSDIDYSFLVGGDGRIYEGWGWENRGTHTKSCCFNCLEVAFIGSYLNEGDREEVTKEQLKYFQKLLEIGVALSSLTKDFKILAQCRKTNTKHLGPNLVQAVKNLQQFEENSAFNCLELKDNKLH